MLPQTQRSDRRFIQALLWYIHIHGVEITKTTTIIISERHELRYHLIHSHASFWYCRRHEVKHACTGACTRVSDLDRPLHVCFWNCTACFRAQKGSKKLWIDVDICIACFTYCQMKENFFLCAPTCVQNGQPKFLSTATKRPDSWLYSLAFRKIKDQGSTIIGSVGEAEWDCAVQRQSPVCRSVSPFWYRALPGAHDRVLNTAVIRLKPSLTTVSICPLSEITRTHTVLLRI